MLVLYFRQRKLYVCVEDREEGIISQPLKPSTGWKGAASEYGPSKAFTQQQGHKRLQEGSSSPPRGRCTVFLGSNGLEGGTAMPGGVVLLENQASLQQLGSVGHRVLNAE